MTRARRCGARLSESSGRGGAGGRAEPSRSEPLLARRPGGAEGAASSQRTPGPRPSAPGRPHRRAAAPAHVSPRGRAAPAAPVRPLGTSARRERGSDGGSAEPEGKAVPRGSLRLVPAGRCSGLEVAQLGAELAVWRTGSGLSRRCQLPGCLFAASSNISPPRVWFCALRSLVLGAEALSCADPVLLEVSERTLGWCWQQLAFFYVRVRELLSMNVLFFCLPFN